MSKKTVDGLYEHFLKVKKYDKIPIAWIADHKDQINNTNFDLFTEYWPDEAEEQLDEGRCNISYQINTSPREH